MSIKQCFSNNKGNLKIFTWIQTERNLEFMCAAKTVLQGKFIPLNVYIRKTKKILKSVPKLPF